jgi:hypothetical protein
VTIRLAIQTSPLDAGSLAARVDDASITVPPNGLVEIPLDVGREHRIAATARPPARRRGELRITPTVDDEGKPALGWR